MITRRHFLGTTSAAGLVLSNAAAQGTKISANDRIQIALIGCGGMGQGDAGSSTRVPGVKLVAAADIYDGRLLHMQEQFGKDIFTTRDYREVLARKDIDAVIVGTPDHWHSRISIDALERRQGRVLRETDGPDAAKTDRRSSKRSSAPAGFCRSAASASARLSTRRRRTCSVRAQSAS